MEFALVVPVLLVLAFGVLNYGYMLSFRQALSQAAAEGARASAVTPSGVSAADRRLRAVAAVNQGLASYGVRCDVTGVLIADGQSAGDCTISDPAPCTASTAISQCVQVSLVYRYRDHNPLPSLGLGIALPSSVGFSTEAEVTS